MASPKASRSTATRNENVRAKSSPGARDLPPDGGVRTAWKDDDVGPRATHGMGLAADPCQAARDIAEAAMRAVSSAEDCRLCLVHHPDTALLVEACRRDGAAVSLDEPERAMPVLRQALEDRQVVSLPDLAEAPCPAASRLADGSARSLLLAPLHMGALAYGVLALSASRPDAFSPLDGERLQDTASQAAAVLHYWARLLRAETVCQYAEAGVEGLSNGLVALDGAGRIIRVNRRLAEFGVFPLDQITLPCSVYDPACPASLRTLLCPSGGAIIGPYEVTLPLPAGGQRTLQVSPSPLSDPALGEVRLVRDVTAEREATEAQILFISQVAHELRGSLQHIMGFAGLLRDFDDLPRENYERFFGHIKDEIDHLAHLIDDLVELSRIEVGRFTMRLESARLDVLVTDVIERMRPRLQLRGLSLTLHNAPEPVWARIDPFRITQVVSNLVENAFKFVPSGGAITVNVQPDGDRHVLVSIADTGSGIPPEAMVQLFQRFFQAQPGAGRSASGMGLGLYTSREIIQAHGGEIWAESEYGRGSTFRFRLDRITP